MMNDIVSKIQLEIINRSNDFEEQSKGTKDMIDYMKIKPGGV